MKCENCGAETKGEFCEYCGSEMPKDKAVVNITNNYYSSNTSQQQVEVDSDLGKCPKCGSSKITFKRERVGTATKSHSHKNYIGNGRKGQSVSQSAYRTIGLCQNCGYTWNPNNVGANIRSQNKTWLWILGWIFLFPIPLTILLLRKKDIKPSVKYGIIAGVWIFFLVIGLVSGNSNNDVSQSDNSNYTKSAQVEQETVAYITDPSVKETTGENDDILNKYISDIVCQYNDNSSEQLVFVEDFTPADKESGHYRKEFRLAAYNEAVGKSYLLGDKVVDIVTTQTIFDEITCRVYTNDTSLEQVVALLQGFSPILDEDLTAIELQTAINEVSKEKTANGHNFGDLGITLSGADEKGYELMLKTD